jgi:hypothetical protein
MSDVFVSYSHRSQKHAEMLAKALESLGTSVWIASKEIQAGEPVEKKIFDAIREARLIAFLEDEQSSADSSRWVQREYMAALEQSWADEGKVLVPILIGKAKPPSFLRHASALRVRGQKSDWTRAAKLVAKMLSEGRTALKRSSAPMREQAQRLNLIEREAHALRIPHGEPSGKL